ncbi:MAG: hypothetical protein JSV36_20335 [Anaerolineae bacterium]|nr:MAG: hypothetical protein JSV36_20335 [Anaerolineae bacterium]
MICRHSLHNILTFDIDDRRAAISRRWSDVGSRYRAFRVPLRPDVQPDLTIEIGRFTPSLAGCNLLDDEYYLKPDYLYLAQERHKLGGAWQFDVLGLEEERCRVRVNANWTGLPFVPGRVIDFFIHYALAKRGYSLMHASAVALDGMAAVYAGRGGGGKTTIALKAVERGGSGYLGDNFILCKRGKLFSFTSDVNMFAYNLRPAVWARLSRIERLRFRFWLQVYRLTRGYIKVLTPVSPLRLFSRALQDSAGLAAFYSLLTGQAFSCVPADRDEIIGRSVSNQKLEFFSFVRYTGLYGCLYPRSDFARHWEIYEDLLYQNLPDDIPYFQLTVPRSIGPGVADRVLGLYATEISSLRRGEVKA